MSPVQNKRVLLVSLFMFFLLITCQARNMPKESTATTTKEVEKSGDKMVTRTDNMAPTSTEDMNMMDYSAARNKIPIHN